MSAAVHAFRVSFSQGGYRSFKDYNVWNAYLLALEDMGHRWTLLNDTTARVELSK